jgi:diguanylate cyclase (GGDEF)-like protein
MLPADLQSRVARRLFGLFLLAAMLPVALLGLFTYFQVRDHLLDQSQQELLHQSKNFGMSLVARLNRCAKELQRLAAQFADAPFAQDDAGSDFSAFASMPSNSLPLTHAQQRHLLHNQVLLWSTDSDHYSMLVRLPQQQRLLQGELRTQGLWRDDDLDLPYCILGATAEVLYCSPELGKPQLSLPTDHPVHAGVFTWQTSHETYLVAYWQALLQASFANPGFTVVTLHAKTKTLAALNHFRKLFPTVLALALVAAAWLSLGQIRRQMRPLHKLTEGAQRLAQGDFDVAVEIQSRDEFAELAMTFNQMSLSLKQKFHLLGALGELDRAILSASEMEYVVRTVLEQIPQAICCDFIGVLQSNDNSDPGHAWLTYRNTDPSGKSAKLDVNLNAKTLQTLKGIWPWLELTAGQPELEFLQPQNENGLRHAWLFPADIESHRLTILILGFKTHNLSVEDAIQVGRSIADRLAIASSNIAWEEKLYHNAHYDALTDLPNRVLLRDRVEQAINRARRDLCSVAVMLLDLDRFKEINDSMGHSIGDTLLADVANRLAHHVRSSDTVARLGGDEFVILLTDLERGDEAAVVSSMAQKLLNALAQPITLGNQTVKLEASIGIALYPENTETFEDLLKGADAAMYESKRQRRGGYRFYSDDINQRAQQRFHLAQELRQALERNEFLLYYQPKVETCSGRIMGAEALIRWQSPTRGMVPPGLFIWLVDEIGLSQSLGEWVLRTACAQLVAWDRAGLPPIDISVNVSPSQLLENNFVESVFEIIATSGLPPQRIELEILEESAVDATTETRNKLQQLQSGGVKIALDDFGTGYSSLVYLTRIPANVLKLDRGFIRDLATNPRQASIISGIINLARSIGMQIVAEGVEEEAQRAILEALDCDLIQGYLFSRPLPAMEFAELYKAKAMATRKHRVS